MTAMNARVRAARQYDAWFETGWGARAWRVESAALLAALGPVAGRRIIEVGCGTGRFTALLTDRGADAIGVDLDSAMLTVAAQRAAGHLICADAAALPMTDDSVDATVTVATLEFTADPAAVLAEMARVTRPGGRLVAAVLNPHSLWGLFDQPQRREPYRSGCFVPAAQLVELAARYGRTSSSAGLYTAAHLPLPSTVARPWEWIGRRWLPSFGALQVLAVELAP